MGTGADIIKKLTPAPMPTLNAWNTIRAGNRLKSEGDDLELDAKGSSKENTNGLKDSLESAKRGPIEREQKLGAVMTAAKTTEDTDRGELVCVGENTTVVRPKFKNKTWSRKDATSTIKGRSRRRAGSHTAIHPTTYPNVTMTNDLFGGGNFYLGPGGSYGGYAFGNLSDLMPPTYTPMCVNNNIPMPMPTHMPGPIPMMGTKPDGYPMPQGKGSDPFMALPPSPMHPYFHQLSPSPPLDRYQMPYHPYYHPAHIQLDPMSNPYRIQEIKNQVLYYFSPENINTDEYLKSLIDNTTGGVLLTELIKFKRLNMMTNNGRDIIILQNIIKYECFPELELIQMNEGIGVRSKYWINGFK